MAPAKAHDDPVLAEYDVFLTPPIEEQVFLMQYPNRPRHRPYSHKHRASPIEMRVKPTTGFIEADILLGTDSNFNKYMGLRWGDATRSSKEIHNSSGTYGLASGVASTKSRARSNRPTNTTDRELNIESDLRAFKEAEEDNKVLSKQTLGGQIIRHDVGADGGKPHYFVGAFKDKELHLTKITGSCQMRPNFHHLDAEDQRARFAISRAQAEDGPPRPEPAARTLQQKQLDLEDTQTAEYKLKTALAAAMKEQWLPMDYVDEEDQDAFDEFARKLKVADVSNLPHLKSQLSNKQYLDAISGRKIKGRTRNSPQKSGKSGKSRETVDLEANGEDEGEGAQGNQNDAGD